MSSVKFAAEIRIHSHAYTGKLIDLDVFSVTGESVPMCIVRFLEEDKATLEDVFGDLKSETPYLVVISVTDEPYGFDVELQSFVELPLVGSYMSAKKLIHK